MEKLFMQEHKRWLKIVEDDLKSARVLLGIEVFSTATYHCQQAAEKALKAYLVFKDYEVIKTHDLTKLVTLCCKIDRNFQNLYKDVGLLNPFSTKFRYPTEFDIPDHKAATAALKQAEKIVKFVLKKISEKKSTQQELF